MARRHSEFIETTLRIAMTDDTEIDDLGMAMPVRCDALAAAVASRRRDMDKLSIRIAVLRSLHGTWPENTAQTARELWHYGSRAIAGDY